MMIACSWMESIGQLHPVVGALVVIGLIILSTSVLFLLFLLICFFFGD